MSERVDKLLSCVERYALNMDRVVAGLRPGDGLFGFGNDPKRSPYHMDFYREIGQAVQELAGSAPGPEAAAAVDSRSAAALPNSTAAAWN